MKTVAVLLILTAVLYFMLNKFFVLRCPACSSRAIQKEQINRDGKRALKITCRICGNESVK